MRQMALLLSSAMCILVFSNCGGSGQTQKNGPTIDVGSTTIFQAAEDPALIDKLDAIIASGKNLNTKDSEGMTALHRAAAADNADAVIKLLRAKADPSIKDPQGRTPETVAEQEQKAAALQAFERAMM